MVLSGEESLFRLLCVHTYMRQSRHKVVQPERWGGWRCMWLRRPRVRTNGYYCLAAEWMKNVSRFDSMDAEVGRTISSARDPRMVILCMRRCHPSSSEYSG